MQLPYMHINDTDLGVPRLLAQLDKMDRSFDRTTWEEVAVWIDIFDHHPEELKVLT